jgi:hypothetical protein
MGLFSSKSGHIDPSTGRNKREVGQIAKRQQRAEDGGEFTVCAPRRQNGRIVESRARFRRRQRTGVDL